MKQKKKKKEKGGTRTNKQTKSYVGRGSGRIKILPSIDLLVVGVFKFEVIRTTMGKEKKRIR